MKKTKQTAPKQVPAYSRLSLTKNRLTVVVSLPSAGLETPQILDHFFEQTERCADFIENHNITTL